MMEESANPEESSNAITVQVDVHHRHYSQLSASIATTSHDCVNEPETTSDLPSIHRDYPKTAAQRMAEYRARKKKETPIVNHRKHKKSGAERAKEYRARKKAKIQSADSIMEESANPEESSNATTVQVDVHHRHYSQLSASIATTSHDCVNEPETTSDLPSIHRDYPKTAAQRMAEYRARKKKETPIVNHRKHKNQTQSVQKSTEPEKAKIQSADSIMEESANPEESSNATTVQVDVHHRHYSQLSASIATTSHDCVNEPETTSDLPSIHRDYPKTAAQRMAEYRARKKKETPIVNHRKHKKSDAERAKEYRARKKAKIQSADSIMEESANPEESSNATTVQVDVHHRHYSQLSASIATTSHDCVNEPETTSDLPSIHRDYPKTAAQRMAEYRARKKKETPIVNHRKHKKSGAERAKEYRARKKAKIQSADSIMEESANPEESSNATTVQVDVHHRHYSQLSASIATTSHDCVNEPETTSDLPSIHRDYPKTAAQRMAEYRARKKKETPIVNHRKHKKSDAERAKEYRARKKAKIQSADSIMEESANPEESSNATTVQVDVHHRHYSQLSASIATTSHDCVNEPETTSDLPSIHRDYPKTAAQRMAEYRARKQNETPIVNHRKHKKSGAERAKEYRARKKAKIQSADSIMEESANPEESSNATTVQVDVHHRHYSQLSASIATTSHDCVNEPETTSDLPSIHRDYPKTAAQRMAEYRARKKKETPIVNHRKHKKSDAERAKEYRARKKAKIQSADSIMEESANPEESSNAITVQVDVHHRHYSQLSASIATTSHDCVNEPETTSDLPSIHRDYPKTAAQRMAEYRARKKKETPIVNHRKHKKSDAERAKEYRARKKAKIQSADSIMEESANPEESSNAITVQVDVHHRHYSQLSASIATTSHDCVNEPETTSDLPSIHRDYPKTAAQRMAEYRARKKKETPIVNHRKHKKSDAERAKEYRARKKAKIQSAVFWVKAIMQRLILLHLALGSVVSTAIVPLIIGGRSVDISSYPYQLGLEYRDAPHCSGSIIGPNKALTAAHCVHGLNRTLLTVRYGSSFRGLGGQVLNLLSVDSHPLFDWDTQIYDVSVLTLSEKIKFDENAKPIKLADANFRTKLGDQAVVTGWGHLHPYSYQKAHQLQAVEVIEVDQKQCQINYLEYNRNVTDQMLCYAYPGGGKDACHGDSGGPLVMNGVQIGIVSWGIGCADSDFPGVYSKISVLRDHIDKYLT
ncbi:hypothetical protein RN001_011254 [Aquatica leii]|uniref:Peptidase S1 domain-containing protein n=1 Tax=Aquatica leii TaxID=1421715 RepID=A0AAN7QI08_9COLE|nr:hypothetical protein RN001_011254 [Aquatica leii]